jgi:cytochrome b561
MVGAYACIELRELYPRGSDPREALKAWHYSLGLSIFAVVWLRLLVRVLGRIPSITPPLPKWQSYAAHFSEFAIYVFMIAMPLLGWMALNADGKTAGMFGFQLSTIMAPDKATAEQLEDLHGTIGDIGYFLIAAHAAAALYHHFIRRDNTLKRMLPGS